MSDTPPAAIGPVAEMDQVGVLVLLESGVAVASAASGNPEMGLAAGLLPIADYYMRRSRERLDQVNDLVLNVAKAVDASPEEFTDWIRADNRHLALFHSAVEGAYETFDQEKVKTLGRVLADGYRDDARLDVRALLMKAIRDLEPPHIRVLDALSANPMSAVILGRRLPGLADGITPILSVLDRHGCSRRVSLMDDERQPIDTWTRTQFGYTCLHYIRGNPSGPEHPVFNYT